MNSNNGDSVFFYLTWLVTLKLAMHTVNQVEHSFDNNPKLEYFLEYGHLPVLLFWHVRKAFKKKKCP